MLLILPPQVPQPPSTDDPVNQLFLELSLVITTKQQNLCLLLALIKLDEISPRNKEQALKRDTQPDGEHCA